VAVIIIVCFVRPASDFCNLVTATSPWLVTPGRRAATQYHHDDEPLASAFISSVHHGINQGFNIQYSVTSKNDGGRKIEEKFRLPASAASVCRRKCDQSVRIKSKDYFSLMTNRIHESLKGLYTYLITISFYKLVRVPLIFATQIRTGRKTTPKPPKQTLIFFGLNLIVLKHSSGHPVHVNLFLVLVRRQLLFLLRGGILYEAQPGQFSEIT